MIKNITKTAAVVTMVTLSLTSCYKDLDLTPKYGLNAESVYSVDTNYKHVLAKIYGGLILTGNKGPSGAPDFGTGDEGFSSFIRALWNLQELPTDEAVCGWTDPGIPELNQMTWSSDNSFVTSMYQRIYYEVALCNEFLRQASDENLATYGFNDSQVSTIKQYRNEVRFLRALSYFYQIDLYGTGPFVTEDDGVGSYLPKQASRADLFKYVESELLAIEGLITPARQNEYGRADRAAVDALLAKLYLNAEVYVGQNRYSDCVTYCDKVINSGYQLDTDYSWLFLADNQKSTEVIFPILSDGLYTQTYGGTTFIVHAAIGGSMPAAAFGVNGGWSGLRITKGLVNCFGADSIADSRYMFYRPGQNLDIAELKTFTDGYGATKWKNIKRDGTKGSDNAGNFVDTDFPLIRLADVYLMYAEATVRGGNGNMGQAVSYVNALRERAFGNTSGNVTAIDLPLLINERGRELHWECCRRTDLIRNGLFTGGTYLWPFKGGAVDGVSVGGYLNLYPLPAADLAVNTNLVQNPGY